MNSSYVCGLFVLDLNVQILEKELNEESKRWGVERRKIKAL